jgi:hypothetical protein
MSVSALNGTDFIIAYRNGTTYLSFVRVGRLSGGSIVWVTAEEQLDAENHTSSMGLSVFNETDFIVARYDSDPTYRTTFFTGRVIGDEFSIATEFIDAECFIGGFATFNNTDFILSVYNRTSGNDAICIGRFTYGEALDWILYKEFPDDDLNDQDIATFNSNDFIIAMENIFTSVFNCSVGHVIGSSVTWGENKTLFNLAEEDDFILTRFSVLNSDEFVMTSFSRDYTEGFFRNYSRVGSVLGNYSIEWLTEQTEFNAFAYTGSELSTSALSEIGLIVAYTDSSDVGNVFYEEYVMHPLSPVVAFFEPGPQNNTPRVNVYAMHLNCTVANSETQPMDVSFNWGNGTLIHMIEDVPSGTEVDLNITDFWNRTITVGGTEYNVTWLVHNTTYYWYINTTYDETTLHSNIFNFHTSRAYDLNANGNVNYLDISLFVSHYGLRVIPPGEYSWDINEDTYTNYLDVSLLVSHYGETY